MTEALPIQIQDRDDVLESESNIQWRGGKKPSYKTTNRVLHAQSRKTHPKGSLEAIVQNLVRTFEMEATYKMNPKQWNSIVQDEFAMVTNGGKTFSAQDIVDQGTYNLFLGDSPEYQASQENFSSSHDLFMSAFPTGFVWEVTEVFAGPPNVSFKWRHWGKFEGAYKGHKASGEIIEVIGMSLARVTDDLKIRRVEHYFDTKDFLGGLTKNSRCPMTGTDKKNLNEHETTVNPTEYS